MHIWDIRPIPTIRTTVRIIRTWTSTRLLYVGVITNRGNDVIRDKAPTPHEQPDVTIYVHIKVSLWAHKASSVTKESQTQELVSSGLAQWSRTVHVTVLTRKPHSDMPCRQSEIDQVDLQTT